jgi:hypothetical protein
VASSFRNLRLEIPSTAFLTSILHRQAYHDDLPSLPYLAFFGQLLTARI